MKVARHLPRPTAEVEHAPFRLHSLCKAVEQIAVHRLMIELVQVFLRIRVRNAGRSFAAWRKCRVARALLAALVTSLFEDCVRGKLPVYNYTVLVVSIANRPLPW